MATKPIVEGATRKDMWMIEPEQLFIPTDPKHPLYDPRNEYPVSEELVEGMSLDGSFDPLLCVNHVDGIIPWDGNQRGRAAIEYNRRARAARPKLETLRILVVITANAEEAKLIGMKMSANNLRRDDSLIEKARQAARFQGLGRTVEETRIRLGLRSKQAVLDLNKLLGASPEVIKAVESGAIPGYAGIALANIKDHEAQKKQLAEALAVGGGTTGVKEVRARVKAVSDGEETANVLPGKRALKRLCTMIMEGEIEISSKSGDGKLDAGFINALRWMTGEVRTDRISGLTAALRKAGWEG